MRGREAVWLWKKKRWRGDVVAEEEEEVKWWKRREVKWWKRREATKEILFHPLP